ncbi:GntR family transcriptional regulator [Kitasatospora albolonga]
MATGTGLKRENVREYLRELAESLAPGDPIPSERTLCAQLGVSRPTLRAAVDELVAEGLLTREHGRGMFVALAKIVQELTPAGGSAPSFSVPRPSGTWTSQVLEFATLPAGARDRPETAPLPRRRDPPDRAPAPGGRRADGDRAPPHPRRLAPGLSPAALESGDFYELLAAHGVRVREAVQAIEPTVVSDREARVLSVPALSPALRFERLTTDDTGRPRRIRPLPLPRRPLPHRLPHRPRRPLPPPPPTTPATTPASPPATSPPAAPGTPSPRGTSSRCCEPAP